MSNTKDEQIQQNTRQHNQLLKSINQKANQKINAIRRQLEQVEQSKKDLIVKYQKEVET